MTDSGENRDASRRQILRYGALVSGAAVFGSVAQEVLLSSPCPVTFVRSAS